MSPTTGVPPTSAPMINPLHMIWDIGYGMLSNTTGIVGVSPPQILIGLGVLLVVIIVAQLVTANRTGWHVEDVRAEVAERMRREMGGD